MISRLQLLGAPEKQAVGAGRPCQSPQNHFAAALLFVKIRGKISLWTVFPLRYLIIINRLDAGWLGAGLVDEGCARDGPVNTQPLRTDDSSLQWLYNQKYFGGTKVFFLLRRHSLNLTLWFFSVTDYD